jgi:hypothetical protein
MLPNPRDPRLKIRFYYDVLLPVVRQQWRRFKASAGSLATTSAATMVVLGLFIYIFGDFFRDKLPQVNPEAAAQGLRHLTTIAIICSGLSIGHYTRRKLNEPHHWLDQLHLFGVDSQTITANRWALSVTMNTVFMAGAVLVIYVTITPLTLAQYLMAGLASIVAITFSLRPLKPNRDASHETASFAMNDSVPPLLAWRQRRLAQRHWPGFALPWIAIIPLPIGVFSLLRGQPLELTYLTSLVSGVLLAWAVPLLIDDDLKTSWIERQAAISHDAWIHSWQRIFTRWATKVFLLTLITYGFSVSLMAAQEASLPTLHQASSIMINGFLTAFPVWLAPAFVMQIDGRKPFTNMVMVTLICVFIGSAVIAAPVAAPLIYLIFREAHRYQGGRFARAANH